MTIGDRIRDRRQELGFSVDELAARLGKTVLQFTAMKTVILKNFLLPYWNLLHPLLRQMKPTL